MLRILKSTEPLEVKNLVLAVYSPPGIGKTSLGFTADKPLLLDFDGGAYRSGNRGDIVSVTTWDDVSSITGEDLAGRKTLVIDTAGRALDVLTSDIIRANPKMGRSGGALTLQGYGELKSRFIAFTKLVRSFHMDIVLLAHSDEQRNGDELIERIDVQGGSKNEIYKAADVMGRLSIRQGQRFLNFSPTDTAFGKNPGGLVELLVPKFDADSEFLAVVISQIKTNLNSKTAAQQKAAEFLSEWQKKVEAVTTPEALNALIPESAEADASVRENAGRLLVKFGKAKGWEWDKDAKRFATNGHSNGNGAFDPLSKTNKDGLTAKQSKEIQKLTAELEIQDINTDASKVFNMPLTIDDLSKEAADRFIVDLTTRADSLQGNF